MHHDLDIHPIPEKVLYINDLSIADTAFGYETKKQHQKAITGKIHANGGILADDNVRIYIPLDLNADQILSRLQQIYRVNEVFLIYIRKKGAYEDIYCKFRRTLKYGN